MHRRNLRESSPQHPSEFLASHKKEGLTNFQSCWSMYFDLPAPKGCPDSMAPPELLTVAGGRYSYEREEWVHLQLLSRAGLFWRVLQQCLVFPEQVNQWPPLKLLHLESWNRITKLF